MGCLVYANVCIIGFPSVEETYDAETSRWALGLRPFWNASSEKVRTSVVAWTSHKRFICSQRGLNLVLNEYPTVCIKIWTMLWKTSTSNKKHKGFIADIETINGSSPGSIVRQLVRAASR
jgi:hypothetical protein